MPKPEKGGTYVSNIEDFAHNILVDAKKEFNVQQAYEEFDTCVKPYPELKKVQDYVFQHICGNVQVHADHGERNLGGIGLLWAFIMTKFVEERQ